MSRQDIWGDCGRYNAVFLSLAGVAMIAGTVVYLRMPEAKDIQKTRTAVEGSREAARHWETAGPSSFTH